MRSKPGPNAVRIAYCGPIARPGHPARGGYESANRRLIDDLRLRGLEIVEMPYVEASGAKPTKILTHVLGFAGIAADLVRKHRRFDLLHLTPLYRQFLYPEAVLCVIAWIIGKRVVLDIRAGSFVRNYRERSTVYCSLADALLRRAELVAIEGREYMPFMAERRAGPVLYLPNYVKSHASPPATPRERSGEPMRIVFLSRIVPEKGVETAIAALEVLKERGVPATLAIIGSGDDAYVETLAARTRDLPVSWSGALTPSEVRSHLAAAHFFIFPTMHRGEGHSNALTEAMAEGVVPICSDNGFNRSVVGECGKILPVKATATDYADAMMSISSAGSWPDLAAACRESVEQHFSSEAVLAHLIGQYEQVAA
jgi:glycosyltransferase involved in cell wall biosynthesis